MVTCIRLVFLGDVFMFYVIDNDVMLHVILLPIVDWQVEIYFEENYLKSFKFLANCWLCPSFVFVLFFG